MLKIKPGDTVQNIFYNGALIASCGPLVFSEKQGEEAIIVEVSQEIVVYKKIAPQS